MPNVVHLTVENADELLNTGAYGAAAIIRLQSGATETGAFADVTGTGSTPTLALVSGTRAYTGYDPAGTVSTWYRSRYENVGATRLSDWTAAFQVSDEAGGQLVSIYDVKERLGLTNTDEDENILEFIRQVSADIQNYTGRRFARIPSSGEKTYLFDVEQTTDTLRINAGIASMSVLEVATISQPEVGGVYTTIPTTDWFLRPVIAERDYGWPATSVCLDWRRSTTLPYFFWGRNVVRATMALGWPFVPADIQAIALNAVVNAQMSKGSGGTIAYAGPSGAMSFLRTISPEQREKLDRYAVRPVG